MKPIQIGILGLGTVGSGTLTVLKRNFEEINRRVGREISVKRVAVRNVGKHRQIPFKDVPLTNDPFEILDDPQIDIVVELIGGIEPTCGYLVQALKNRKHIVTANKELIALRGSEFFKLAQENSVVIAFEAAVGGGISIIKAIREGLAGNRIQSLTGIINGTSNYILTGMKEQNCSFKEMLHQAQKLGFAEADPTFDIEGIDAVHKLTILASIAFGIPLQDVDQIYREGISKITSEDIAYAEELKFKIKPIAVASSTELGIELRVHPSMIATDQLLANVDGVMNAVMVNGDAVGQTLYYGAGAGAEPTASAVVADIVDVARVLTSDPENRVPHLAFQPNCLSSKAITPLEQVSTANYLRIKAVNRAGVLAEVAQILGDHKISIESILQKKSDSHEEILPIVIITQQTVEKNMHLALQQLQVLDTVVDRIMRIRIENLA